SLVPVDPCQHVRQLRQHPLERLVHRFESGEGVHLGELAGIQSRQHLVRMREPEAPRDPKLQPPLRAARQFFSSVSASSSVRAFSSCAALNTRWSAAADFLLSSATSAPVNRRLPCSSTRHSATKRARKSSVFGLSPPAVSASQRSR